MTDHQAEATRCPSCGHENREGASFCEGCGAALQLACPVCGADLRSSARFCDSCGHLVAEPPAAAEAPDPRSYTPDHLAEKILAARSAVEGERKQVTVLFADVKGHMDLAERVDIEAWHRIMDRFFAILCEGVHRFEGTVTQFTGDGIMNRRNLHAVDEIFADDFVDHQGGVGPTGGREAVKAFVAALTGGFPDMRFEVVNMVAEGDRVFTHVVGHGTHSGDFAGIPATGRDVTAAGMSVVRVAHGKVVERWNIIDFAGLMQQITS